jgi:hypothetical protein
LGTRGEQQSSYKILQPILGAIAWIGLEVVGIGIRVRSKSNGKGKSSHKFLGRRGKVFFVEPGKPCHFPRSNFHQAPLPLELDNNNKGFLAPSMTFTREKNFPRAPLVLSLCQISLCHIINIIGLQMLHLTRLGGVW